LTSTSAAARTPALEDTFVLVARGAISAGEFLDLVDLAPSTIRVSWTHGRGVTYLSTGEFLDHWCAAKLPEAHATLGLLRVTAATDGPVPLHVREPRIVGSGLRWTVVGAEGRIPHTSGSCVLVLNPPEE
jgi:hypothetical protein